MKKLDLTKIDKDKLPNNWTNFICDISTEKGFAYEISSFSGDRKYRCEIMQHVDYWAGKCTCQDRQRLLSKAKNPVVTLWRHCFARKEEK